MNNNNQSKLLGRRKTLQLFGVGVTTSGFLLLEACWSKGNSQGADGSGSAPGGEGCNTPIDEASKSKRKLLQYAEKAAVPEKHCSVCAQYEKGKFGDCGGCKVIPGPVKPDGGCLSFAPLDADAGTPTKAPG